MNIYDYPGARSRAPYSLTPIGIPIPVYAVTQVVVWIQYASSISIQQRLGLTLAPLDYIHAPMWHWLE